MAPTRLRTLLEETDDCLFAARVALEKLRASVEAGHAMPSAYLGDLQAMLSSAATCMLLAKHEQQRPASVPTEGMVH